METVLATDNLKTEVDRPRALHIIAEIFLVTLFIAGFAWLAAYKIGFHPVPWKDEGWFMQPAYEIVQKGHMCLPMFRHRGSGVGEMIMTDPVFTYLLAGWYRLYGFGIREARLFNLTISVGALLLVYLIGRRWGGRWAGAVAVVLLAFDNNYFTGSRFLRNDFTAVFFALGAAFCYLQWQRSRWWLPAAGLCAGLSALSHLNGIYVIALLGLWLFIDHGWRIVVKWEAWLVAAGLMILLLPYGAYCLYYKDIYLSQWHLFASGRARGLTAAGLWQNILGEPSRYKDWHYGVLVGAENRAVLFFQAFTLFALLYLLVMTGRRLWRRESLSGEPRVFVLIAIFWCALFFTTEVSNKTHSYLPHLTTWFALAIGIAAGDLVCALTKARRTIPKYIASGLLVLTAILYLNGAVLPAIKYYKYSRTVEPVAYERMVTVFQETVEPDLVPVGGTRHWYLFATRDDYHALTRKLSKRILQGEFEGEQYAVIMNEKERRKFLAIARNIEEPARRFSLLAELPETPYGPIWIYYVGNDPAYLNREGRRF
jgi:4-amino-4-deoxy-L-arabinose transferase-like glycosyltransferase